MSKTFDLSPVFGPSVSVRHQGANFSPARRPSFAAKPSRRAARRPVKSKIRMWSMLFRPAIRANAMYGLLFVFGVTAISYVFLINGSAAKGYEMKKVQNRVQEQTELNHSLEIRTAQMASLGAIDQAAQNASLVSIKGEEFLTPATVTALNTSD